VLKKERFTAKYSTAVGQNQTPRSIERISSIHEKHILALWAPTVAIWVHAHL